MTLAQRLAFIVAGVLGAAALVLGMTMVHKPAHLYEGLGVTHASVVKSPAHLYEG
jgi:hypothetical protein